MYAAPVCSLKEWSSRWRVRTRRVRPFGNGGRRRTLVGLGRGVRGHGALLRRRGPGRALEAALVPGRGE